MSHPAPQLHDARYGREELEPRTSIGRHRHNRGYIAVILSGAYQEAGLSGRYHVRAGDVLVHGAFDAHLDYVSAEGAEVLNLPHPPGVRLPSAFRVADPDEIVRLAERDVLEASQALIPEGPLMCEGDWPDRLALEVAAEPTRPLQDLAEQMDLAPETLSRGFGRAYGITPARFRSEIKAQRALASLMNSDLSLAAVAADCGYADQSHFTRAIVQLTGRTPGFWRRQSNSFKNSPLGTS